MRLLMRCAVLVTVLILIAPAAWSKRPSFKTVLKEVRDGHAELTEIVDDVASEKTDRLDGPALFRELVRLERDLEEACKRTGRFLADSGSLYVEIEDLTEDGWTFAAPPELQKRDKRAERARDGCFVATHRTEAGAEPDIVMVVEEFQHKSVLDRDGPEHETYPFREIDRVVECRDVEAILQAHMDTWLASCAEPAETSDPKRKSTGIAKWTASAVGKPDGAEDPVKVEWYAWEGEPFAILNDGATFVATVTYTGEAREDRGAARQVADLLGEIELVIR